MTSRSLEKNNYSCWMTLQYVGLKTAGVPAIIKNKLDGGKVSMQMGGKPLTDLVTLRVHQGGLRDRALPTNVKELFRKEIMPTLAITFPNIDQQFIGMIELNFNEGILTNFHLAH